MNISELSQHTQEVLKKNGWYEGNMILHFGYWQSWIKKESRLWSRRFAIYTENIRYVLLK